MLGSVISAVVGAALALVLPLLGPSLMSRVKHVSLSRSDMLIVLSGARLDILKQVPTERLKFLQLGILVLVSALLATVSMVFALWHGVQAPLPVAIIGALLWGFVVLNLNRFLVASLPRTRNRWTLLLTAVPRVMLSVVLGLIITVPIVLQIFASEISAEIPVLQHQQAAAFVTQQDALNSQITASKAQIKNDTNLIAAGGFVSPYGNSAVVSLQSQLAAAQSQRTKDYGQWQCELLGGPGCISNLPGAGPAAALSQRAYEEDVQRVNSLSGQLTTLEQQLAETARANQSSVLAAAKKSLASAQAQLATEVQLQATALNSFSASNSGTGLLVQLRALYALTSGNTVLTPAWIFMLVFFALVYGLPVIAQALLKLGPESVYDKVLAHNERIRDSIARQRDTMLHLEADRAISQLGLSFRSAADAQQETADLEQFSKAVRWLTARSTRRERDLDAALADLLQTSKNLAPQVSRAPAKLAPFQAEAVPHEDGELWRLQLSEDEFLLIDSLDGVPTINWTARVGAKEFASLVAERLGPPGVDGPAAEMTLSVAGIEDQLDARLGIELAFLASPAFDERSEFVRFDDEHVAMALQSMHGDDGTGVKLFGLASVEMDLDMLVSLLARTGTPGLAAHARASDSPLIKRLNELALLPVTSGVGPMSGSGAQ